MIEEIACKARNARWIFNRYMIWGFFFGSVIYWSLRAIRPLWHEGSNAAFGAFITLFIGVGLWVHFAAEYRRNEDKRLVDAWNASGMTADDFARKLRTDDWPLYAEDLHEAQERMTRRKMNDRTR